MCKLFFDLHLLFVCSHSVHQEARTAGQSEQSFQSFPENYKSEGVGSLVNATAIHPRILQTAHKVDITFIYLFKTFHLIELQLYSSSRCRQGTSGIMEKAVKFGL